ncbi:MAG: glucosamine-6-phosphate deaminase [Alphaproteobacteria bacterium]
MRFLALKKGYDEWVANYILDAIKKAQPTAEKPFVLGLPTGSAPIEVYRHFVEACRQGEVSFKHVVTFNMDEYIGLAFDHPQSYHYFMNEHLFNHIDIPKENINIPNGMAKDIDGEVIAYEEKIRAVGGIDLFLGGVGSDGHIAFNEPGSSLSSYTREKTLTRRTLVDNARFFDNDPEKVPPTAITVGIQTIMDAKEVIILAKGLHKALAIQKAVEGPVNHMCPVTVLQMHRKFIMVCDELASVELRLKTIRYFSQIEGLINPKLKDLLVCYRDD